MTGTPVVHHKDFRIKPLYLPCKRFHAIAAWLFIAVDVLLILSLCGWLVLHYGMFHFSAFFVVVV